MILDMALKQYRIFFNWMVATEPLVSTEGLLRDIVNVMELLQKNEKK